MQITTQEVFTQILDGEILSIPFVDKREFDSLRVSLLRRFSNYNKLLDSIGADSLKDKKFLRASWNPEKCSGTFALKDVSDKKTPGGKVYTVTKL